MMRRFKNDILLAVMAVVGLPIYAASHAVAQTATDSPVTSGDTDADASVEEAITPALPKKWVDTMQWRSIGPASMGGRITDLAVFEEDPCVWWAATASGGLLKTINNGITFEHQFDHEATVSIGAVAVAPSDQKIVWVGTGEGNPRNSVSWGDGVYKSIDGGKTWKNMGLKESYQTGRIKIHPTDPDIVYVGALGRLWGSSEVRGLYKTTDGGETWDRILFVDDMTGVIEIQMHPTEPDTLLVATYERQRDGFDTNDPMKKIGPGSGLHKTTDGGKTWREIRKGLPSGNLGRIGIDYYRKDPNIVYMVLESEKIGKEPENAAYAGLRGQDIEIGAKLTDVTKDGPADKAGLRVGDVVLAVDDATVHSYNGLMAEIRKHAAGDKAMFELSRNRRSEYVEVQFEKRPEPEEGDENAAQGRPGAGRGGPAARRRANRSPFGGRLGGQRENMHEQQGTDGHEYGGLYKSTDGGDSWTRINSVNPRPMYFSQVRVDPSDNNHIFVLGVSLYRTKDGGETVTSDGGRGVHSDHHAMWVDPKDGRHIILGGDGGIYVTQDRMEKWDHLNHVAIGQFYHVGVGPRRNYRVYGGLQDNGSWGGPSRSASGSGPINADWFRVGGGDGFVCLVDPNDPDQIYYESQNGSIGQTNLRTGDRGIARPRPPRGERYRFNWQTPFILSNHNSKIYYTAGNHVFRSLDRGQDLKKISPEIARTKRGSATALSESAKDHGVLYVGTDDGAMWVTRDAGYEWTKVIDFPDDEADEDEEGEGAEEAATIAEAQPQRRSERRSSSTRATGRASSNERRGGRRGGAGGGQMLERLMRQDANGDGKIQRSEASERMKQMFDRIDRNGDGVLDKKELQAFAERPRSGRRPPPSGDESDNDGEFGSADEQQPQPARRRRAGRRGQRAGGQANRSGERSERRTGVSEETAAGNDPITGEWRATAVIEGAPSDRGGFDLSLKLGPEGKVTGTLSAEMMGDGPISEGRFNAETNRLTFVFESEQAAMEFSATLSGSRMTGDVDIGGGMFSFGFSAERTSTTPGSPRGAEAQQARDEKYDWKPLTELLPGPRWVSAIEASRVERGRAYVTLDGHRSDDDEPYVFVTEDAGETWRSIRANLPTSAGSTKTIREDVVNANILYLGTEFGLWVSIDRGDSWTRFNSNLPTVAVHEIAIHPTAGEIVAATHGRSLWVLDVTPLRQMLDEARSEQVALYEPNTAIYWRPEPNRGGSGARRFVGQNQATGAQIFYSLAGSAADISLKVTDLSGKVYRELTATGEPGLHRADWNLRRTPRNGAARRGRGFGGGRGGRGRFARGRLVESGKYLAVLTVGDDVYTKEFRVETDPDYPNYRPWVLEARELELLEQELEYERQQKRWGPGDR